MFVYIFAIDRTVT